MKPAIRLALGLLLMLAIGCQYLPGDKRQSVTDRLLLIGAASLRVTPSGGGTAQETSASQVTMSLSVPQGAVEDDTTITYTRTALPSARDGAAPVQAAYTFGPENLQFSKPATLTICYDAVAVAASGMKEKTLQIQYLNQETGELVSMGGDVNLVNHCVSAGIYHFSTYVLTAQLLAIGDNPPTIGGATFFPATLIQGLPATVRSAITDWDAGSAIATVRFYYRTAGSGGPFKSVAMLPETNDGSGQFYAAKIPGVDISAAGLDYYIEAYDSLNSPSTRPATAPAVLNTVLGDTPDATTPIRFQTAVTQMSAGFSRDLTVQVRGSSSPTFFPVPAETLTFAGNKGVTSRPTWLSARYSARTMGSSFLQATYGSLNASMPISVYPGMMTRIDVLLNNAALPNPFYVNGGSITQLDAAGYDAYNNFMFVQPVFGASAGVGTFGDVANYGKFYAANVAVNTPGTISATVGGYTITYNIQILTSLALCMFDTGMFDTGCVFN